MKDCIDPHLIPTTSPPPNPAKSTKRASPSGQARNAVSPPLKHSPLLAHSVTNRVTGLARKGRHGSLHITDSGSEPSTTMKEDPLIYSFACMIQHVVTASMERVTKIPLVTGADESVLLKLD